MSFTLAILLGATSTFVVAAPQLGGLLPTGLLPTGIIPTGIIPTGIIPTDILPTGILPTGIIGGPPPSSPCSSGVLECCQTIQSVDSLDAGVITNLLNAGIPTGDITGLIGFACNPLSIAGLGTNSCNGNAVCCNTTSFSIAALGCSPANIAI